MRNRMHSPNIRILICLTPYLKSGARGSITGSGTTSMLHAGRPRDRDPMRSLIFFSIYLIPSAALGPGVYSASKRNKYQKHINNVSGE
jgi:cation transporter-like permease